MGTSALLAAIVALVWTWLRGIRRDYDEMRTRQQRYAKQPRDMPMDRSNPDFIPGHVQ